MNTNKPLADDSPSDPSTPVFSPRLQQAKQWLREVFGDATFSLQAVSADASFRSYWRVYRQGQSHILMDAPPDHEDCRPFCHVAQKLTAAGVHVPRILARNLTDGFLLLEDFGNQDYLQALNEVVESIPCEDNIHPEVARLYGDALAALLRMQTATDTTGLPVYDREKLLEEMHLFRDWFLIKHLDASLSTADEKVLTDVFACLAENALGQPRVFVHRDYHSRNLMVVSDNNPGVLDFQDAVIGPVTYDLVSLFKDCYIKWPSEHIHRWSEEYRQQWQSANGESIDADQWRRWFDLMGAQRHLKAVGIFCRLNYRDGKNRYLRDIPRTLSYLHDLAPTYPELHDLLTLVENCRPRITRQCAH